MPERRGSPAKAGFILALRQQALPPRGGPVLAPPLHPLHPHWSSNGGSGMVKETCHPGMRGLWSAGARGQALGPCPARGLGPRTWSLLYTQMRARDRGLEHRTRGKYLFQECLSSAYCMDKIGTPRCR